MAEPSTTSRLREAGCCDAAGLAAPEPRAISPSRGVSLAGIAAREGLTAKRSRPEMAPQRLEKIESAPGNGMGSEASNLQDVVHGCAADLARLRLTSRGNDEVAMLQKKAPML